MVVKHLPGALLLLFSALVIAVAVNRVSPKGIEWVGQWDRGKGVVTARSKSGPVLAEAEVHNPLKVLKMVQSRSRILIDVRLKDIYDMGHLPGALSFPLHEFDQRKEEFFQKIKPHDPVLVYCSGVTCTDSHTFAARLRGLGFTNVKVYAGGFQEWEEMGFDIE